MGLSQTAAVLFGSVATATAIFGGGLAVEAYRHRRARIGMALALAGAIDALLRLIEARDVTGKLSRMLRDLEAGRSTLIEYPEAENLPFRTITNSFAGQIGSLRGDLPFRVARFLTHTYGVHLDLQRLNGSPDIPRAAALIREIQPLWNEAKSLGDGLVRDLRASAGRPIA